MRAADVPRGSPASRAPDEATRPLPWAGLGLVLVVLTVPAHGYDLLPDPVGWALVGHAVTRLRLDPDDRRRTTAAVWLAAAVTAALWPAPVAHRLADADPSLAWAASLPQVAAAVLLCTGLATLARRAGDGTAARWLDVVRTLSVVAGVLPVLAIGGHLDALDAATELVSVAAPVALLVLALRYARRPWAAASAPVGPVRPG